MLGNLQALFLDTQGGHCLPFLVALHWRGSKGWMEHCPPHQCSAIFCGCSSQGPGLQALLLRQGAEAQEAVEGMRNGRKQ